MCYFKALQIGDVNKVTPIDKSSIIITMILAFVILGESITLKKFIAIIAILIGIFFIITKKDNQEKKIQSKWILYAILSAVFASLTSILGKIGIVGIESNLGTAIRTIIVLIMAWAIVFMSKKQREIKNIDKKSWIFICLSGVTTGLSWLCYYRALQIGKVSVVVPIDKLSIVVTIGFSYIFLKEKLTKMAGVGLILIVIGTLILLL